MENLGDGRFLVLWREVKAVRKWVEDRGIPSDPNDVRTQFVRMVMNAEGLRILFGGQVDRAAVEEAHALVEAVKAVSAWESRSTHHAHGTRQ